MKRRIFLRNFSGGALYTLAGGLSLGAQERLTSAAVNRVTGAGLPLASPTTSGS